MKMTLIKYRTSATPYNQYAVVPTGWFSDLLDWLALSEHATIIETTHNRDDDAILPISWPNYQTCVLEMRISDVIAAATKGAL